MGLNIATVVFRSTAYVQHLGLANAKSQNITPVSDIAGILLRQHVQLFTLGV